MKTRYQKIAGLALAGAVATATIWGVRSRLGRAVEAGRVGDEQAPAASVVPATAGSTVSELPASVPRADVPQVVGRALLGQYSEAMGGRLDGYTVAELVANLQDALLPWKVRRRVAWELARRGTDDAFAALRALAGQGLTDLRAVVAEALGYSPHPDAGKLLLVLLQDQEETVVRGAVRGVAIRGGKEAVMALQQAFGERTESGVREEILMGLAKQPWELTRAFFEEALDEGSSLELRVAVVEALANGGVETAPVLLQAAMDAEPQMRASAAWALAMQGEGVNRGAELAGLLRREPNPQVRAGLYQALLGQAELDLRLVLPVVLAETDPETRLAGLGLWAASARGDGTGAVRQQFDSQAVPELKEWALTAAQPNERLSAVIALRRSRTVGAQAALREIAAHSGDGQVVVAAQAALARARP